MVPGSLGSGDSPQLWNRSGLCGDAAAQGCCAFGFEGLRTEAFHPSLHSQAGRKLPSQAFLLLLTFPHTRERSYTGDTHGPSATHQRPRQLLLTISYFHSLILEKGLNSTLQTFDLVLPQEFKEKRFNFKAKAHQSTRQ